MSSKKNGASGNGTGQGGSRGKVGPGNPPEEYRWKPGQCPNPNGRGGKKKEEPMNVPTGASPAQQALLEFASTRMGSIDGKEVTTHEGILRTMRVKMSEKPEFAKLLLQAINEASQAEEQWRMWLLQDVLAYKDQWGPKFALARKTGRPEPEVYPHPDDLIVKSDGTVVFDGPVTKDDARRLDELLEARDLLFEVIAQIMEEGYGTEETLYEAWRKARRQYYRVSPGIPKRLKKPFPKFEPNLWEVGAT